LWAHGNLMAKLDWGYRAQHVVAVAGKALTEHYFGRRPKRSYFVGSSTGGRQALQEAQRFPLDFDGIVAIAPPVDLATVYVMFAWGIQTIHDRAGMPLLGRQELELLTEAALAKCDMSDGLRDRIIGDPFACAFDPSQLICSARQEVGCLRSEQVEAARKIYAGPLNSKGERLSLGGPVVGSEIGHWDKDPRDGWGMSYLGLPISSFSYERLITDGMRYLFFWPENGPSWQLSEFDFDRDPRRMAVMQALYDSSNPDLRKFKTAGSKLLIFQGLNDNSVLPRQTIDYYETVERTMGGRALTQSFCRLFLLPGVGHGGGGEGAGSVDYLSAIEAWSEEVKAPDRLIAARLKNENWRQPPTFPLDPDQIQFTRALYPYPLKAKYLGRGDPNDADSFGPNEYSSSTGSVLTPTTK
jgi:feruloyl esterase